MTWDNWLKVELAPEVELKMEVSKREILESDDHKEVAMLCANLFQQNTIKDHLIKNLIGKVAGMEAKLIKIEMQQEKKKEALFTWLERFFNRD